MIRCERTMVIDASPEAIWNVIGRYMDLDEFAPLVKSVEALTEGADGVGSVRRCHFENGTFLDEEVMEWEPNHRMRVRMFSMDALPLKEAQAEICIKPYAGGKSQIIWYLEYRMKYGPLGWLLGQTLVKSGMGKVILGNLKGLAEKVKSPRAIAA
ncbi:SRPBCC family protein [Pseudovibrio sp. FO-BEG1]|uniref:SRPBCC family protein n=1 Tax=Pseudovibrio sp. (strain FO-BEG1) TaxID=911045 RepID=UPI001AD8F673|nr:SRPBCC family protein [Pseudovibrio sp. FO-BEG1]